MCLQYFRIMAFFYFINWIVAAKTIEGRKLCIWENMVLWFQCVYWDCNLKQTLWWKEECSSHHICMNFLKRVKKYSSARIFTIRLFFHVKSCPISGSVADPALTGTRATTLFSKIVPTFCRLGIISIQKLLYYSLSNFRFGCRPSPYRYQDSHFIF